jgi:transposase
MARRKFTREFKVSAVKLVNEQGYEPADAARSLGVDPNCVRGWVEKFGADAEVTPTGEGSLKAELRRLRKENARLLMEREILKKRRHSLPGSRREVRLRQGAQASVAGRRDLPASGGQSQRIFCLAQT